MLAFIIHGKLYVRAARFIHTSLHAAGYTGFLDRDMAESIGVRRFVSNQ
jgi:hypothetical protein